LSLEWKTRRDGGSFVGPTSRWCDKSDPSRLHVTAVPRRSAAVAARASIKFGQSRLIGSAFLRMEFAP